ncbi:Potassium channel GORK [Durusdinium trenchii]|uniref:Potassium channel GORK n=1 Tax=Durusdinium trenchii TaxID=1381693 RepID=A0ABP0PTJ1_9DINO
MGAFLQVGFSTMSATSLAPMMCYKHPNGLRSILKYPGVICGSDEHTSMLVIGWLLLSIFVLGFVALCTFAVTRVPSWSATRKDHLVACVRFLVFRFRLDSWWFGVPLLCRGPLLSLPVVLATDYPPVQILGTIIVIAVILAGFMAIGPHRLLDLELLRVVWWWFFFPRRLVTQVPMLNLTDAIISFCVVLLVTTSSLHLPAIEGPMAQFAEAVSTTMLSGIGVALGIMVLMTGSALIYRSALGGKKEGLTGWPGGDRMAGCSAAQRWPEGSIDDQSTLPGARSRGVPYQHG